MKLLVAAAFVALVAPLQAIKASRGIHPNLAPLFNVRTDFARTDLDKFKGVAAKLDNVTNQIVVVNEVKVGPSGPSGHAAWAHLADRLNETGWMELHVSTPHEAFFSNDVKMYSAGLLEGLLSAERMSQFYSNFYPLLQPEEDSSRALLNIRNLFNLQVQHVMHQCGLSGGLGEEPEDPYWKQVRYLFLQMWGLKDAYNVVAQEKGVSTIDMVDMFFINSHAELGEMMQAYSPEATAARAGELAQGKKKVFLQMDLKEESQRKGENSIPVEVDRDEKLRLAKRGHCSALVRLAPSNGELLVGHTTWIPLATCFRLRHAIEMLCGLCGWSDSESEGYSDDDETCLSRFWRSNLGRREIPSPQHAFSDRMKSCTPRRRPVLSRGAPKACGAALVLLGITSFAAISLAQKSTPTESQLAKVPAGLTAEELLSSERLLSVASDALLKTWKQQETWPRSLQKAPEELVHHTVADAFANMSRTLKRLHISEELDSFSLTEGQLEAIRSTLAHLADPQVQDIGSTLAKGLKLYFEIEGENAGKEGMKLHLLQTLQPQIAEIRSLWREVKMGALHGPGLGWGVSVDPSRLFLVQSFDPFQRYWPGNSDLLCQSLASCVQEGSHEEIRTLLLQMQALLSTFGLNVQVAQAVPGGDGSVLSELMACAMRYAALGLDVISSIRGSSPTA